MDRSDCAKSNTDLCSLWGRREIILSLFKRRMLSLGLSTLADFTLRSSSVVVTRRRGLSVILTAAVSMTAWRRPQPITLKTGHFYFGKNRTFLFWLDTRGRHIQEADKRLIGKRLMVCFGALFFDRMGQLEPHTLSPEDGHDLLFILSSNL